MAGTSGNKIKDLSVGLIRNMVEGVHFTLRAMACRVPFGPEAVNMLPLLREAIGGKNTG